MTRRRVYTGSTSLAVLAGLAMAGALGVSARRDPPTGGFRDSDDEYEYSAKHTGYRRTYADEPTQCDESPRDDRPEWQKIGDRKGRSRPNKGRR